ncbi:MAG: hypothetical protein K2X27_27670 [Candidatus Obscuribacterales bacterium]|nr:hypothetical protein [Candidatus Obscuribacterales bacterium]
MKTAALLLCILLGMSSGSPAYCAKKAPFSGNWISKQYTNGREFILKLQQSGSDLIGWEGRLPANTESLNPDLKGTIKGKVADVDVSHRRGYQAHVKLSLRGNRLVWQLLDSDARSNRYFPLASTLNRKDEDIAHDSAPIAAKTGDQLLFDLLEHTSNLESDKTAEGETASAGYSAYKALLAQNLKADNPNLQALLKSGNAAARVYAAFLLWDIEQEAGKTAFQSLTNDAASLNYKSGKEIVPTTVAIIAQAFLKTGAYLDFPSKKY